MLAVRCVWWVAGSARYDATYLHGIETLQLSDNFVDAVWRESLTQKMVVLGLELSLQLVRCIGRID